MRKKPIMEVQSNSSNDTGKFMAKADKGSQEKQSSEKSNQLNFIFEENFGNRVDSNSNNISQNNDQDTPVLGQIVPPPKSEGSSGSSESPLKRL